MITVTGATANPATLAVGGTSDIEPALDIPAPVTPPPTVVEVSVNGTSAEVTISHDAPPAEVPTFSVDPTEKGKPDVVVAVILSGPGTLALNANGTGFTLA